MRPQLRTIFLSLWVFLYDHCYLVLAFEPYMYEDYVREILHKEHHILLCSSSLALRTKA